MAKKLTAAEVARLKAPGRHPCGEGLYLQVTAAGRASWLWRYQRLNKAHEMGLGPYPVVTLATAREAVLEARRTIHAGLDPLAERRRQPASEVTFAGAAEEYIASHTAGWRNPKSAAQWRSSLATYAIPRLGGMAVAAVGVEDVLAVLKPIWSSKPETARRIRGRIEAILDAAKARGLRDGENPARWQGGLDHLLPSMTKVREVRHHEALPPAALPGVMAHLAGMSGTAALAVRFIALTACRASEALGATWTEIKGGVWIRPAARMKAGVAHRQPLSRQALAVLEEAARRREGDLLFPGAVAGKPVSLTSLMNALRAAGAGQATVHGLRTTFRTWAAEVDRAPREVAEMCLAHTVGTAVERAYARTDLIDQRRELLQRWADHAAP